MTAPHAEARPTRISRRTLLGQLGALAATAPLAAPAQTTAGGPPGRDELELRNDRLRLILSPRDGAGILAWALRRGESWIDLYPDVRDPVLKMRFASWMMIPYSNRIANGRFMWAGREYQLRNGENHAIHGDARNHPWSVTDRAEALVRLALDTRTRPAFNWPWPMELSAEIRLEGTALVQRLRIVNRGDSSMPAGFGWHPYYRRALTRPGEPVRIAFRAAGVWPDPDGDCLPNAPLAPLPPDLDCAAGCPVPTDRRYDTCLGGFDGRASIEWPDSGVRLHYECSPNVRHLVYFNPIERPVFALEPAANANNGVNLLAKGWANHGVIELPAGEALDAEFVTRVESGSSA
ncbi:MAG: hypothetical protein N2652_06895 [Kiritimatiellae bacterium]|nr:hypothetical protein [Kiritimatiellia bacterium]